MPARTPKEQAIMIGLVFVALAVLVISFVGIKKNISGPFDRSGERFLSREEKSAAEQAALKTKDTDGDELTDYEELYIYETSAYLADTDSDGYTDGMEVKSGNNPNCPSGKTCTGGEVVPTESSATVSSPVPTAVPQEFNPVELRALLRAAGVSDEILNQVDDATLRQLYQEAVASSSP